MVCKRLRIAFVSHMAAIINVNMHNGSLSPGPSETKAKRTAAWKRNHRRQANKMRRLCTSMKMKMLQQFQAKAVVVPPVAAAAPSESVGDEQYLWHLQLVQLQQFNVVREIQLAQQQLAHQEQQL